MAKKGKSPCMFLSVHDSSALLIWNFLCTVKEFSEPCVLPWITSVSHSGCNYTGPFFFEDHDRSVTQSCLLKVIHLSLCDCLDPISSFNIVIAHFTGRGRCAVFFFTLANGSWLESADKGYRPCPSEIEFEARHQIFIFLQLFESWFFSGDWTAVVDE